jgi:hypothetical protein
MTEVVTRRLIAIADLKVAAWRTLAVAGMAAVGTAVAGMAAISDKAHDT